MKSITCYPIIVVLAMFLIRCHEQSRSFHPGTEDILHCSPGSFPFLQNASFRVYFADNSEKGSHFAGYNGLATLIPHCLGQNIFVPHYAGMNYEIIQMDGNVPYEKRFEPRVESIKISFNDETRVILEQPRTSHSEVSATITFRIEEPFYLHQEIKLTFHKRFMDEDKKQGFRGLFASYIFMPEDPRLYLRPDGGSTNPLSGWYSIYKTDNYAVGYMLKKIPDSVFLGTRDHLASFDTSTAIPDTILLGGKGADEIPLYYYYGFLADSLVFIQMFKQPENFRFAYSPAWGGHVNNWVSGKEYDSPAWDYVVFHEDVKTGETYTWDCCIIVKPWAGREDVIDEYTRYLNE